MRRPISILFLIYTIGIVLGSLNIGVALLLIMATGFVLLFILLKQRIGMFLVFLALFFVALGFYTSVTSIRNTSTLKFLHNNSVQITARIIQPPIHKDNKSEYILELQQVMVEGKTYSLSERALGNIYLLEDDRNLQISVGEGDIISFTGKIRMPKGKRNPGGFDYALYLKSKKIYSSIIINPETIVKKDYSLHLIPKFIYQVKDHVEGIIDINLPENYRNLLKGILFGQKELDDGIRNNFVQAGIAHILAVSGLHVGIVIGFTSYMTKILKLKKCIKIILLILILVSYIIMTGAVSSVLRASLMAWIYYLSKFFSKRYDGISALSLSGFAILLPNPLLLFSVSFQLSFLAALSIIIFYPVVIEYLQRIKIIPSFIASLLAATIAAQLGTIPVSLYHFNRISMVSIFTNLLIIPVLGTLLFICFLGIIFYSILPFVGRYFFFLSRFLFEWILRIADLFSSIPMSSISLPPFSWLGIVLYTLLLLVLGAYIPLRRKKVKKVCLVGLILLIIIKGTTTFIPKPLRVTFLDVGQGDSILIQTPGNKNLLLDGGGYPSYQDPPGNIAEDILIPVLYAKGIRRLDFVLVSHPHDDHMKGIQELIGAFPIDAIGLFESGVDGVEQLIENAKNNSIKVQSIVENNVIDIEKNLHLEIISPSQGFVIENQEKDLNNTSIVARLDYHKNSFLFTGDIESEMETQLVNQDKNIQADVLKVAHHGSSSSSTKNFIDRVEPAICIISVGESNNFGHPDAEVVDALENRSIKVFRTDRDGAIEISTNGYWIKGEPFVKDDKDIFQ